MPRTFIFFLPVILLMCCKPALEKIKPKQEKITSSVYASGIVKSRNQYQVFSTVNGIIKDILVTEGETVNKGDLLFRLSDATARLNSENAKIVADYASLPANADKLTQLKIDIDVAKSKMDNESSLLEKQMNLWVQGIGTRNELDQRGLQFKTAVNAYQAAKARLGDLQQQLSFQARQSQKKLEISNTNTDDYSIRSEINGKVYRILKEKGEMVNTQNPVAIIGDANGFVLELQVDEYDITRIRLGQKILLNMDSYKGQVFEAVVSKIDPLMNPQSKSFTVTADFTSTPPTLYPNLTTEANIIIEVKEKALTIPRNYLTDDNYVIMSSKEKRKVTTGLKDYQKVEILNGLTGDEEIIKPQ
jgi:multidrug efflux pump subunit AcrA (membrane-fusion protein)